MHQGPFLMQKSPGRSPGRTQTYLSRTTVKNVTSPAQRVCRTIRSFHLKVWFFVCIMVWISSWMP